MSLVVGNVYVVFCHWIKPPHDKIAVCLCAQRGWFFWFNSKAAPHAVAQIAIDKGEHPAISKDCFLDLSGVRVFSPNELRAAQDRGPLSAATRAKIAPLLLSPIKLLPDAHRTLAASALA